MLKSQEIQIAQSKRREKMAEIQKADEITDDARSELRSLTDQYQNAEIELRAALTLEGAERDAIREPDKGQSDFERECRSFDVGRVVAAITDARPLSGREAEVTAELEQRFGVAREGGVRLPWEALETRADATIATAPQGGDLASRPVMSALERFFQDSAAERFGVRTMAVSGRPTFPQITGGADVSWVAEGNGADAAAITTTAQAPSIHTATARYLLSRQATKENPALEPILRRDLQEVIRAAVDKAVFQGSGVGDEPSGLTKVLTDAGRTVGVDDKASFSTLNRYATELWESAKLAGPEGVRIAGAPIVHQTLADTLIAGTAVSELDRLKAAFSRQVWSSQVSERGNRDATDLGASNVLLGAGDAHAYALTWGGPELIIDPFSESKTGKIALTLFTFVDIIIQRAATHYLMLSGIQDR